MRKLVALLGAVAALGVSTSFAAYPERPVKLVVPWAAGGDTDNIFRPLAPLLQKHLGQPVVIANVGGASGTVGAREASLRPRTATAVTSPSSPRRTCSSTSRPITPPPMMPMRMAPPGGDSATRPADCPAPGSRRKLARTSTPPEEEGP